MLSLRLDDAVAAHLRTIAQSEATGHAAQPIAKLNKELREPPRPHDKGAHYAEGTVISHRCLIDVARWAIEAEISFEGRPLTLDLLLRNAKIATPIKPKAERSPALIETLRKIELQQEEEAYAAMLPSHDAHKRRKPLLDTLRGSTRKSGAQVTDEEQEWLEVRQQLSAILNILVSVAAVATAVWWAGGTADPIWKTLVALPLSILVAIAEAVLYARHWDNVRKRRGGEGIKRR